MFRIQTIDNISPVGLKKLPRENYEIASEIQHPDVILLRSSNIHDLAIPSSLKAVGRAGAGVNNVPVDKLTQLGIPVFNAPGANANAVKELVIAGMLMVCRNICVGWDYVRQIEGDDHALHQQVEKNKKQFVGFELQGKTLGVIGLGAIGVRVANAAIALGMDVIGHDPEITVQRAWELSSAVQQANSVDEVIRHADFITVHVPLVDETQHLINASRLKIAKPTAVLLNFSRQGIVDDSALLEALTANKLYGYVTDFPSKQLLNNPRVIVLPHLGASTKEAEENCAVMVAEHIRDFLEKGHIRCSVNFPNVAMPKNGKQRLTIANANVPNMVAQISARLAAANINIADLLNKSRGNVAYTVIDVNEDIPLKIIDDIRQIAGVLSVRVFQ